MCLFSLASCGIEESKLDPFPVPVDLSTGALVALVGVDDKDPVPMVLDVLTPVSAVDSRVIGEGGINAGRRRAELTLYGLQEGTQVPRLRFDETTVYSVPTCDDEGSLCRVGGPDSSTEVSGIIGGNLLTTGAFRIEVDSSILRFFPDSAGSDSQRTSACDAVFGSPFKGGGTLISDGTEVSYPKLRPILGACMHNEGIAAPEAGDSEVGTDLHLALSTALGPTLLSTSAYQRYAQKVGAPLASTLPTATLQLVSGPLNVRLAEIPFLALVGSLETDSDGRGPCRELYANARMRVAGSCSQDGVDCPCPEDQQTCRAAAALELSRPHTVAIVDANLPLLQALRDEVGSEVPGIDGILGTQSMGPLALEFDYPNGRILANCKSYAECATKPQVRSQDRLGELAECRRLEAEAREAEIGAIGE